MRKLFFAFIVCLFALNFEANAQSAPVPDNYVIKTKDDCAKYQDDVLKTIDWLQNASWSEPLDNRKPANAFVLAWISASPDVTVTIESPLVKLTSKNPELLMIFMGGYTKYALQHKADFNKTQADVAAIKAMIDKYTKETASNKDNRMEKLAELDKNNKLEDWIKSDFEKK